MDDIDFDDIEATQEIPGRRSLPLGMVVPIAVLVVAVALIAGLVYAGVIGGSETRSGPEAAPTTVSTVQIVPLNLRRLHYQAACL